MRLYKPRPDKATRVQAEAFSRETGGAVMITRKVNADGLAFKNWDAEGHAVTWEFDVPSEGDYALWLRYCHTASTLSTRSISWNGEEDPATVVFPSTGGWSAYSDDWSTLYAGFEGLPAIVHLKEGPAELTMTNRKGRPLNLDWIELVPVADPAD